MSQKQNNIFKVIRFYDPNNPKKDYLTITEVKKDLKI